MANDSDLESTTNQSLPSVRPLKVAPVGLFSGSITKELYLPPKSRIDYQKLAETVNKRLTALQANPRTVAPAGLFQGSGRNEEKNELEENRAAPAGLFQGSGRYKGKNELEENGDVNEPEGAVVSLSLNAKIAL
jgi:hypothetical protein